MKSNITEKVQMKIFTIVFLTSIFLFSSSLKLRTMADVVQTPAPNASNITVKNYICGIDDKVTVSGLQNGDIVKVYDQSSNGSILGQATASSDTAVVDIPQLQTSQTLSNGSFIYVSATIPGESESNRVQASYVKEPLPWQVYDHTGNWGEDFNHSNFTAGQTNSRKTSVFIEPTTAGSTGTRRYNPQPPVYPAIEDNNPLGINYNKHIIMKNNGKTVTFYGYGSPSFKDFLFLPDSSSATKTFSFDMDFSTVSFHTLEGAGILFNTKISSDGKTISGYAMLVTGENNIDGNGNDTGTENTDKRAIKLYRFDNIDVNRLHQSLNGSQIYNSADMSYFAPNPGILVDNNQGALAPDKHSFNVTINNTTGGSPASYITIKDTVNGTSSILVNNQKLAVAASSGSYGVGLIASYYDHNCSVLSYLTLDNVAIGDQSVGNFPWPILDFTAAAGQGKVTVSYTKPSNAEVAVVQASTDSDFSNPSNIITVPVAKDSTGTDITGLSSGTLYYFRLLVGGGENAGASNVAAAAITGMTASPAVLTEAPANDGSLASGFIKLKLSPNAFSPSITAGDVTVNNLPSGMDYVVNYNDPSSITVTLTGKASANEVNDSTNITVTVKSSGVTSGGPFTTGNVALNFIDPTTITASPSVLTEASANDGSLASGKIIVTAQNGSFASDIGKSDVTINGLPSGMDYSIIPVDSSTLAVLLTGKAVNNESTDDTNIKIKIAKDKLIGAADALTTSAIAINFIDIINPPPTIRLSQTGTYTFSEQTAGYSSVSPKGITINKIGTGDITNLKVSLSGTNSGDFALQSLDVNAVTPSGAITFGTLSNTTSSAIFNISPKTGLSVGNYTAAVNITADNGVNESFDVVFVVKASIPSHSGGDRGESSAAASPVSSKTVTGSVTYGGTNNSVSNIAAEIIIDSNGNAAVSVKAAQALVIKQPDGNVSAVSDLSKVSITDAAGASIKISADGKIEMKNMAKGTDNKFQLSYDLGNGQKIYIGTIEVKVGSDGTVSITESLIDPYGIITDAATGKAVVGVNVTLYYANTERNKASGKTADTVVALPGIEGFKPNNNKNPQVSDASGAYGFMVFPDTDYYIIAAKDGYNKYTSPTISVGKEIVKWDFNMTKSVQRLSGATRVDTALSIAKATYSGKVSNVILTTEGNYPDALAGSVLAYKLNAPILLAGSSDKEQQKVLDYMKDKLESSGTVYILGGTGAVEEDLEKKIASSGFSKIIRINGSDRYETDGKLADMLQVKNGTPIILVSGENYPDALSISSIAAVKQYPILLVKENEIPDSIKNKIAAIKPQKIYIIGLNSAVSTEVENEAAKIAGLDKNNVVRIGGANRFETSLKTAKYFNLSGSSVCIATGSDFPDALAGSVYAAKNNAVIMLTDSKLSEDETTYLKDKKLSGVTIFGGEGAVNNSIEQNLVNMIQK